ncbi:SRPBCC family protein [Agromyces bracchium]|uniref:SRPBCC family protein n=1 Tax=Agromyces bracchium TaxID=88376 RepID=A0A6I3M9S9_9MICO|nr:SRPBCC family protein [Agromyces bracchium]MTH69528.1 SRPBCC family protein [Agromyces bracchium]
MTSDHHTAGGSRAVLVGSFELPLSRREAFRLFSARGEELWVPGWVPRFFVAGADDLEVGTVWQTSGDDGRPTTWVVLDCEAGVSARYARVAEGWTAGTVTVELADLADRCLVRVAYDLTALTTDAAADLDRFADGYADYLGEWRTTILDHLASGGAMPDPV